MAMLMSESILERIDNFTGAFKDVVKGLNVMTVMYVDNFMGMLGFWIIFQMVNFLSEALQKLTESVNSVFSIYVRL